MSMCTWGQYSSVSHQSGSGLPQEGLEVSSSHQLQQDEPGHGLQTDSYAAHNVLVAELTAGTKTQQGGVYQKWLFCLSHSQYFVQGCFFSYSTTQGRTAKCEF